MLNYAFCTANSSDPTNEYKDKAKHNAAEAVEGNRR